MTIFCSTHEFEELCRGMAGKADFVRLQAKGGSMYPFITSGDWVDVAPFGNGAQALRKGDIVLFRKDEHLYMHRVIKSERDIFIAKGDVSFGNDGAVPKENIIGKVVSVRKSGRAVDLSSGKNIFISGLMANLSGFLQYPALFASFAVKVSAALLSRVQGLKSYRTAIKKIIKQDVVVRDAIPEDEEQLRDLYTMAGYDVRKGIAEIGKEGSWLVAQCGEKITGGLTVTRHENDPALWVIFGLQVKPLVRGLGIGERIVKEALARAKSGGAKEIGLFVNKRSSSAIGLYKKLGFAAQDAPGEFNRSEDEFYLSYKM